MEVRMSCRVHVAILAVAAALFGAVALPSASTSFASNRQATQRTGITITGTVVDASLAPLPGAVVTLEQNGREIARATTDAKGAFRIAGSAIAAGEYQVKATLAGYPVTSRSLRVPAGATTITLPIVLAKPADALK